MATETRDRQSTCGTFYKEIVGAVPTESPELKLPDDFEINMPWNAKGFDVNEHVERVLREAVDNCPDARRYALVFKLGEDLDHLDPVWLKCRIGLAVKQGELPKGYIESMDLVSRADMSYFSLDFRRAQF